MTKRLDFQRSHFIVLSDCHRGNGAAGDEIALPQGLGKPNLSLTERRYLETGIGMRDVRRKDKADPVYYNTGSCVHPRGITGIEITAAPPKDDGPIRPHFILMKRGYLAGDEVCNDEGCRNYPLAITRTILETG